MRILCVNYEYPPLGGGGGVAAANLARAFVQRGHEVDYITSHFEGLARAETLDGVRLHREPVIGRTSLQTASIISMLSFPVAAAARAAVLRKDRAFDILHTHFAIPSGPAGYALSLRWKLPNVLSVYGGDIYDPSKSYSPHRHPILKWAVKRVLNQADFVIAESRDLADRAREIYRPATEILRIPLGFVPVPFIPRSRAELGLREDCVYAIAVSRLVARKGYACLLDAFAQAAVENLRLLIIGEGPEETAMRAQAAALGIEQRIQFLGAVDDERKYQLLHAADFFALATLHEGFGIVFQEAMHCGLPIVTTNAGGQTDFLAHGRNALLVAPNDSEAFAAALRRAATEAELRRRMSEANREDIAHHEMDAVADQYLTLFGELVRRNSEAASHAR